MSDITNRLTGILDTSALTAKGGGGVKLFGLRLRSTGFTLSAAPNKVAELQKNAKLAAEVVQGIDEKAKQLEALGKQAESAAKAAADAYNGAIDRYNRAANAVNAAADRYNKAIEAYNAKPDDKGAKAAYESAKRSYEAADREFKNAESAMNAAKRKYDAASGDIKAVENAIAQFEKAVPKVLADVGRQMGLEDVLVQENKRDAKGNYTNDKMTFNDQASTLLQSWAASMKEGVELDLRDSKGNLIKVEDDTRLVNPFTRERFKTLQVNGDKAKVTGEEAMIVRNMGAISMFRKLFQSLMEELTAVATRRRA